jgi:hypothetical protein
MAQGDGKEGGSSPHIRFGPPQIQVLCNLIWFNILSNSSISPHPIDV